MYNRLSHIPVRCHRIPSSSNMLPRPRAAPGRASADMEAPWLRGLPRFLQAGAGWSPKEPAQSHSRARAGQGPGWGGKGRVVGAPVQPPAFLRPSKLRRLPRVPAAPLGDLALHKPHKLASTTLLALRSGLQCPHAASPETQKPTKDTGLIKRHFLSSALVSNQFPLLLRSS